MQTLKSSKTRTAADRDRLRETVRDMIETVVSRGDDALREYNSRFDGCERTSLHIREFAKAQRRTVSELEDFSPMPGIMLGHRVIPVDSCCCYVPGGGYPLYSTALMLGIPAKVAGVRRVAACSPVMKGTDHIHPKTLVAMDIAGIDEIYATGGAQAVAAFSYGTDQIKPVDLIVGPGNSFVTEAKRQCYGKVGIDFLAGPSEVLVIADGSADPEIIAADLLAQSEHDREAKGILVTTDRELGLDVIKCVEKELETLATAEIASVSWADYGEVLLADSLDEAVSYANGYAPEHLEVNVAKADRDRVVGALRNYGSLFIGENTAEVFGDYASGTNHTLPTLGAARYTGGVWVGTFLKTCTYQHMTDEAMMDIAPVVTALADGEGLAGHAEAADIRRRKQEK